MQVDFHLIKRLPPYVFNEVNRLKAEARAEGRDIIDFGMGNPDQPTPEHIVEKLVETARNPKTHRYSPPRAFPVCAVRSPPITNAASGFRSIRRPKPSSRWDRRKGWRIWRWRSPRRAT